MSDAAIKALRADYDRLRGRLFQTVEATGMPDRQQQAFKGLIRQLTYDSQANIEGILRGQSNGRTPVGVRGSDDLAR